MVEFKDVKHGAIITADSFEELKEFINNFNKEFPEHLYKFSSYTENHGKHIATYYLNTVDKDGSPIAMM